jgi:hypothetical protein
MPVVSGQRRCGLARDRIRARPNLIDARCGFKVL